ncbi:MAG: hypothetical protein QM205_01150 [Bacillota bacterium]|nr:hypothetical protein [Bacillota bacterium]
MPKSRLYHYISLFLDHDDSSFYIKKHVENDEKPPALLETI